jgi:putative transcriptional regulator
MSLRGHFLIAAPALMDPNFHHSVVLLLGHDDGGALGLVLTRASKTTIKEAWEQIDAGDCQREDLVHVGGPCPGPLMALHAIEEESNTELMPGVFLSQASEKLERLVNITDRPVKFFVGYAGWGPGQLEGELAEGAWHTVAATPAEILSDGLPDWEKLLKQAAGAKVLSALKLKHVPPDPRLN